MHKYLSLGRDDDRTVRGARLLAIVLLLMFIVLNLLISVWSQRLLYYKRLEIIRTAQNPNIILLGTSIAEGISCDALVQGAPGAGFRPLNAGLGGTEPPEHRLLFEYAVGTHPAIRTLVVAIFDFQLTKPDSAKVTDLVGNRMVGFDRRFPRSEVASVYGFKPLDLAEFEGIRDLPAVANRGNFLRYIELLHDSKYFVSLGCALQSIGMLHSCLGDSENPNHLAISEAASPEIFDTEARSFLEHPDRFNASYESIFTQARRAGMSVVVVVMPMSPFHRATFYERPLWGQYLAALTRLAGHRDIRVIDAENWMPNDQDFHDHMHLESQAVYDFSVRLGSELAQPH